MLQNDGLVGGSMFYSLFTGNATDRDKGSKRTSSLAAIVP